MFVLIQFTNTHIIWYTFMKQVNCVLELVVYEYPGDCEVAELMMHFQQFANVKSLKSGNNIYIVELDTEGMLNIFILVLGHFDLSWSLVLK